MRYVTQPLKTAFLLFSVRAIGQPVFSGGCRLRFKRRDPADYILSATAYLYMIIEAGRMRVTKGDPPVDYRQCPLQHEYAERCHFNFHL